MKNCQNGTFETLAWILFYSLCRPPHPFKQKNSSHLWATPTKTTTDDNHVRWSSAPVQIPGEKHRLTLLHHNEISNSCANYEWWVLVVTQETTWLGTCPFYFTAMQYHCTVKQPNSRHAKKCILPKNIQTKLNMFPNLAVWQFDCIVHWTMIRFYQPFLGETRGEYLFSTVGSFFLLNDPFKLIHSQIHQSI